MNRKIIAASMIAALAVSSVAPAYAEPIMPNAVSNRAEERIPILIDGLEINSDQPPVIVDDRTLVPLRVIFEALGATVDWNNDTRSVIATRGDTNIYLALGSNTLYRNGQPVYLDVPGQIINDRTMVPVRAVSESFGANVVWDNDTRTVFVDTNIETSPENPDQPGLDEPTNPEFPDIDYPDVSDPTEPVPPVEPDYPEVNPPEENQPSIDEQEKNIAYNAALLQLRSGYSYDAYYGFKALGDYKDSADLMNQAWWLNQISYDASEMQYHKIYEQRYNYELISENQFRSVITTSKWLQPSLQSMGGNYYIFNPDGTGISNFCGISGLAPNQIIWSIEKGGVFYTITASTDIYGNTHYYDNEINSGDYIKECRKLADGVYADIDLVGHFISGPRIAFEAWIYVDYNTNIGKGLNAYWTRIAAQGYSERIYKDANGLFYGVIDTPHG